MTDRHAGTVVIADDDRHIRQLVAVAARRAGADVVSTVADGASAFDAIRDLRPDLAILDVSMPAMSGVQVCRAVRADPDVSATKLMLLSAAVHSTAVDEGKAAGADLYGQKPFAIRSLEAQIRDLLAMPERQP